MNESITVSLRRRGNTENTLIKQVVVLGSSWRLAWKQARSWGFYRGHKGTDTLKATSGRHELNLWIN